MNLTCCLIRILGCEINALLSFRGHLWVWISHHVIGNRYFFFSGMAMEGEIKNTFFHSKSHLIPDTLIFLKIFLKEFLQWRIRLDHIYTIFWFFFFVKILSQKHALGLFGRINIRNYGIVKFKKILKFLSTL